MPWWDNLQLDGKGAFRGIEFFVDSAETSAGRRTVLYEYPGSDHVETEDLGRSPRRAVLTAYVIGPEYMTERDKLLEAFETSGPGPLVHPYIGEMIVSIEGDVRVRETHAEGGIARFTLNVVRVSEDLVKIVRPDTVAAVATAADEAVIAVTADLEEAWTVTGVIESVRTSAQSLINGANGIVTVLNKVNGYADALMNVPNAFGAAITALGDEAATLILTPSTLASRINALGVSIIGTLSTVTDAWDAYFTDDESPGSTSGTPSTAATGSTPASGDKRAASMMVAFRDLNGYGSGFTDVSQTTPQREAEAGNQDGMVAFMRSVSTIEICRAISEIPFSSYDAAAAIRDELGDALDTLADIADDASYYALVELRAAISSHLAGATADLPRVISYTPAKQMSALVIAQILYGDSTRDADIIDRNNIRNPCKVPGGEALEVLSR